MCFIFSNSLVNDKFEKMIDCQHFLKSLRSMEKMLVIRNMLPNKCANNVYSNFLKKIPKNFLIFQVFFV